MAYNYVAIIKTTNQAVIVDMKVLSLGMHVMYGPNVYPEDCTLSFNDCLKNFTCNCVYLAFFVAFVSFLML